MRLPIDGHLPAIAAATEGLVLTAEPGAGKTTRVPPALLNEVKGTILVVEPRRLAARSAARRVASELGERVGERVGYAVRFDRKASAKTRILFVTEGILLRRFLSDPSLRDISALIFDELHERKYQMDLALALAVRLRARRRAKGQDLRLIAMSATLSAGPVARFLDAPSMHVEGRTFPVSVEHRDGSDRLDARVASAVREALRAEDQGDVLVFLPGMAEIVRAQKRCAPHCKSAGVALEILHGDVDPKEQDRIVREGPRKVVLSTNLAESSVTLPGVTCVIDSGLVRRASHSPWTGLPSLRVQRISQASAVQRAGRAGRVREGRAVRLFSEADFRRRPAHDTPEIARMDLCDAALLLHSLGEDPAQFTYFESPPPAALSAADALLRRLGALDEDGLTDEGKRMRALPLHPRLARLVLEGERLGVGARACTVAAIVSEGRLVRGPTGKGVAADVFHDLEAYEGALVENLRPQELRARGLAARSFHTLRQVTKRLRRQLGCGEIAAGLVDEEDALRVAIARAFPDRIGRHEGGKLVFEDGRGVLESDVRSAFMVAVDVQDRSERGGRGKMVVRSACEIAGDELLELFLDEVEDVEDVRFDEATERVVGQRILRYGALELESSEGEPSDEAAAICLAGAAWDARHRLFDLKPFDELLSRLRALGALGDARESVLRDAIAAACQGARSFSDLRKRSLADALASLQPPALVSQLAQRAPAHIALPGRKRVPVHYEADRPPWIASRMQDFFGLKAGPKVGDQALVLHLLAPNRRAVQVTDDLAGFWQRHYPELRKQLKRRYPKHAWPEDPTVALPPRKRR
ncbi:MAG: ATP-dependent helicase HrpB [Myxococcota bacterium]